MHCMDSQLCFSIGPIPTVSSKGSVIDWVRTIINYSKKVFKVIRPFHSSSQIGTNGTFIAILIIYITLWSICRKKSCHRCTYDESANFTAAATSFDTKCQHDIPVSAPENQFHVKMTKIYGPWWWWWSSIRSDDPSSNPAEVYNFFCLIFVSNELKWNKKRPIYENGQNMIHPEMHSSQISWPIFNYLLDTSRPLFHLFSFFWKKMYTIKIVGR